MVSTCNICCDFINKSTKKLNQCPSCDYEVCSECNIKFILSVKFYASCMNCKSQFTYETMEKYFTKKFINGEYTDHINKMLIDKDKARLPEDQPAAEFFLEKNRIIFKLTEIAKEYKELQLYVYGCDIRQYYPNKFIDVQIRIEELRKEYSKYNKKFTTTFENSEIVIRTSEVKYIRKCIADTCKGFLNIEYKCGICNILVCKDCNEIVKPEHICDKDTVATIKIINLESKQCPKVGCDFTIYKTEGCDQMYCTQCHTAWDWKTGNIETKRIHNPHYYEYIRQINNGEVPREQDDNQCGNILPNLIYVIRKLNLMKIPKNIQRTISHIHRMHIYIEEVIIPRWNTVIEDFEEKTRKNRINYLISSNETEYTWRLIHYESEREMARQIIDIYMSLIIILKDKFQDIMIIQTIEDFNIIYESFDQVKLYINELIEKLSKRYNNRSIDLIDISSDPSREWTLTTTRKLLRKRKLNMQKEDDEDDEDNSDLN